MLTLKRLGLASLSLAVGLAAAGCGNENVPEDFFNYAQIPAQLVFSTPPQNGQVGQPLPDFIVQLQDQNGNVYVQATGPVVLTIGNNPGNAQLLQNGNPVSSITVQGVNGQAVYSGVSLSQPGEGYTLIATVTEPTTGITLQATSPPFTMTSLPATSAVLVTNNQVNALAFNPLSSDTIAMDEAFGVGNYTVDSFTTVNVANLFQPGQFIFFEVTNGSEAEFNTFMTTNRSAIEAWIRRGGRAFINNGNNPDGAEQQTLPFGVLRTFTPGETPTNSVHVDGNHPIGQAMAPQLDYQGEPYAFSYVGGAGLTPITVETETEVRNTVVGELNPGAGRVLFGGITPWDFHGPQFQALILYANYLRYAAGHPPMTELLFNPVIY